MKLSILVNSQQAIGQLMQAKLKVGKAYELAKFIRKADDELKDFNKVREDKIKEYGEEKDGQIKVKDENIQMFTLELNDLLNEEVDIVIPEIQVTDIVGESIETNVLLQLDWLIKE